MSTNRDVIETGHSSRNPARYVAALIGVAAIVFGALALAETGLDTDHLRRPHESFATFHHTPLLALMEIAFGVVMLVAALGTVFGRILMAAASVAALAFGAAIVLDLWPRRLHNWFGVHDRNGWLFVIVGGVGLAAAVILPFVRRQRVVERETVVVDRDAAHPVR